MKKKIFKDYGERFDHRVNYEIFMGIIQVLKLLNNRVY